MFASFHVKDMFCDYLFAQVMPLAGFTVSSV
jgi:hypothetical protein